MVTQDNSLVLLWRSQGPAAWCEGPYGWIGMDGLPIHLLPWQRAVLDAWWQHREEVSTLGISNVKKTGKTFIDAVITAWRWLALPGLHLCVANDLDQAQSRQFLEIADMVQRHPYLSQHVRATKTELEFTLTGSKLEALANDYTGAAGANFLSSSHTEAWGIAFENSVRLWEELTPVPGRFYGLPCLRVADSYAGYSDESRVWHNLVDNGLSGKRVSNEWPIYLSGGLLLFHYTGQEAQERCFRGTAAERKAYYSEQRRTLRSNTYLRLHENIRTANVGNFCQQEDWEALIDPKHKRLKPEKVHSVYVGLDLAVAPGGDNCALIGVYRDAGKVKVAFHKVWQGGALRLKKLSLTGDVGPYIQRLDRDYKIAGVYFDPWQAIALSEILQGAGIHCVQVNQGRSSRGPKDTALFEMVSNSELVLYDDEELRYAPGGANAKELGNGQIFLTKAGGRAKIDLLVALSNCASECREDTGGGVMVVPNPWEGDNPWHRERGDEWISIRDGAAYIWCHWLEPHPKNVTAENCRHSQEGCKACVEEREAAGYYQAQYEAAKALEGVTYDDPRAGEREYFARLAGEEEVKESKVRQTFWKSVSMRKKEGEK